MISRIRWARCRQTTWVVAASTLVILGCSVEEKSDADSQGVPESEFEIESDTSEGIREGEVTDDPVSRARIEILNNDATESLVRAADFLAEQAHFQVVADISFDVLQSDGRLLEFGASREITIRRPDRMRMREARRDGDSRTVYFDGSTLSMDLPGHQAFVQIERPGTLYAALEYLVEDLGAPVPLANLFSENLASPLENQIESGYYVGTAKVGGRLCEHLAFRLPDVDVQLWIEEGSRPLIARIVITYKRAEGNPQFRATLRDWDLTLETPDTLFHFEPAEGSEPLVVGSLFGGKMPGGEEIE